VTALPVRRGILVAAAVGLVLFAILALAVRVGHRTSPFGIDAAINSWIAQNRVAPIVSVSIFLARIGAGVLGDFIIPGLIILGLVLARRWRQAIVVAVALIASSLLVEGLKVLVHRARPLDGLTTEPTWSFPSGHSTHAATLVVMLMIVLRWRWFYVVGAAYAVAMAASRVYLGVHWLSDVAGGLVLGAAVAVLVSVAFGRLMVSRRATNPAPPPQSSAPR
jgi:membrane-associated phospholipid phosphatase